VFSPKNKAFVFLSRFRFVVFFKRSFFFFFAGFFVLPFGPNVFCFLFGIKSLFFPLLVWFLFSGGGNPARGLRFYFFFFLPTFELWHTAQRCGPGPNLGGFRTLLTSSVFVPGLQRKSPPRIMRPTGGVASALLRQVIIYLMLGHEFCFFEPRGKYCGHSALFFLKPQCGIF